jgi:peptide/nickel transport system substrate-binding protein
VTIRGEPGALIDAVDSVGVGGSAGVVEVEQLINVGLAEVADYRVVLRPRLAETIPSVENGLWKTFPDGRMETTWKIRQGVQWHDGAPFTSADLVFTNQVGQDQDLAIAQPSVYRLIENVEAPDPSTVTVQWKRPFILADTMFTNALAQPMPRHILEPIYLQDKSTFTDHPYWNQEFVGTGPFKVREFVRGSHVILDAFDHYVMGRPKIDEIEVKFLLDPSVIVANVLAGTVDITIGRGLAPDQAMDAERQWPSGKADFTTQSWTALYPQHVDPNPPALANLSFRRALMYALDREQLVNTLLMGRSRIVSSFIGPNSPEFTDLQAHLVEYPYDQRRATELISGLGMSKGPDGMFRDSAGQPVSVEIRTTAGDDLRNNAMLAAADMWTRVGIGAEPVLIPRQRASDREYRVVRPAFELTHQPNELTERSLIRLHSKQVPTAAKDWAGQNRARYSSPELDALIDQYFVTYSPRERLEAAKQINYHISDQLPVLGLFYRIQPMLIANRLVNVSADAQTRNSHEWDLR